MDIELYNEFEIKPDYRDEVFIEMVQEDTSDPMMPFKIRPNGNIWPEEEDVDEFIYESTMTITLIDLVESIEGIYENKQIIVELVGHGTMYLAIEERDDESVWVTNCFDEESAKNPEDRSDIEVEVPITKDAVAEGILEAANEFYEKVVEINPDMAEDEYIQELKEKIEEAEEIYEMKKNSK